MSLRRGKRLRWVPEKRRRTKAQFDNTHWVTVRRWIVATSRPRRDECRRGYKLRARHVEPLRWGEGWPQHAVPYKGQLLDYGMTAVAWLEKELSRPLESTAVVT